MSDGTVDETYHVLDESALTTATSLSDVKKHIRPEIKSEVEAETPDVMIHWTQFTEEGMNEFQSQFEAHKEEPDHIVMMLALIRKKSTLQGLNEF